MLVTVVALATVPLLTSSNVVLNFMVMALLIALVGQGWNLLGGYGGQYSFGHAAFFGTGCYVTAILQMRYGVNAWPGFAIGMAAGAVLGAVIVVLVPEVLRLLTAYVSHVMPAYVIYTEQAKLVVFGLIVIGLLIAEPRGVIAIWDKVKSYFQSWPYRYV